MCIGAIPLMNIHDDRVQLLQTGHRPHQKYHKSSSLHSLNGPAQQIGCNCFEILQDEHLKCITQYFVRLLVIGVPNLVGANKQLEGVIDVLIVQALHLQIFNLSHTFLLMRAKLQLVLIAPEHFWFAAAARQFAEHVVEVEHLVS